MGGTLSSDERELFPALPRNESGAFDLPPTFLHHSCFQRLLDGLFPLSESAVPSGKRKDRNRIKKRRSKSKSKFQGLDIAPASGGPRLHDVEHGRLFFDLLMVSFIEGMNLDLLEDPSALCCITFLSQDDVALRLICQNRKVVTKLLDLSCSGDLPYPLALKAVYALKKTMRYVLENLSDLERADVLEKLNLGSRRHAYITGLADILLRVRRTMVQSHGSLEKAIALLDSERSPSVGVRANILSCVCNAQQSAATGIDAVYPLLQEVFELIAVLQVPLGLTDAQSAIKTVVVTEALRYLPTKRLFSACVECVATLGFPRELCIAQDTTEMCTTKLLSALISDDGDLRRSAIVAPCLMVLSYLAMANDSVVEEVIDFGLFHMLPGCISPDAEERFRVPALKLLISCAKNGAFGARILAMDGLFSALIESAVLDIAPVHVPVNLSKITSQDCKLVATGADGKLYKAKWEGVDVAVKVMKNTMSLPEERRYFLREISIMSLLSHPNLLSVMAADATSHEVGFISEYMPHGNLESLLKTRWGDLDQRAWVSLGLDIAEGLAYLHRFDAIHRDLKPANVLIHVDSMGRYAAKVCDFGLARVGQRQMTKVTLGTPLYIAPEIYTDRGYGHASDVFSYAFILVEMVSGVPPLADKQRTFLQLSSAILEGLRPKLTDAVPRDIRVLLTECWAGPPSLRPTFSRIVDVLCNHLGCEPKTSADVEPLLSLPTKLQPWFTVPSQTRGSSIDDESTPSSSSSSITTTAAAAKMMAGNFRGPPPPASRSIPGDESSLRAHTSADVRGRSASIATSGVYGPPRSESAGHNPAMKHIKAMRKGSKIISMRREKRGGAGAVPADPRDSAATQQPTTSPMSKRRNRRLSMESIIPMVSTGRSSGAEHHRAAAASSVSSNTSTETSAANNKSAASNNRSRKNKSKSRRGSRRGSEIRWNIKKVPSLDLISSSSAEVSVDSESSASDWDAQHRFRRKTPRRNEHRISKGSSSSDGGAIKHRTVARQVQSSRLLKLNRMELNVDDLRVSGSNNKAPLRHGPGIRGNDVGGDDDDGDGGGLCTPGKHQTKRSHRGASKGHEDGRDIPVRLIEAGPTSDVLRPSSNLFARVQGNAPLFDMASRWACPACSFSNDSSAKEKCALCDTPRPASISSSRLPLLRDQSVAGRRRPGAGNLEWACTNCHHCNPSCAEECEVCEHAPPKTHGATMMARAQGTPHGPQEDRLARGDDGDAYHRRQPADGVSVAGRDRRRPLDGGAKSGRRHPSVKKIDMSKIPRGGGGGRGRVPRLSPISPYNSPREHFSITNVAEGITFHEYRATLTKELKRFSRANTKRLSSAKNEQQSLTPRRERSHSTGVAEWVKQQDQGVSREDILALYASDQYHEQLGARRESAQKKKEEDKIDFKSLEESAEQKRDLYHIVRKARPFLTFKAARAGGLPRKEKSRVLRRHRQPKYLSSPDGSPRRNSAPMLPYTQSESDLGYRNPDVSDYHAIHAITDVSTRQRKRVMLGMRSNSLRALMSLSQQYPVDVVDDSPCSSLYDESSAFYSSSTTMELSGYEEESAESNSQSGSGIFIHSGARGNVLMVHGGGSEGRRSRASSVSPGNDEDKVKRQRMVVVGNGDDLDDTSDFWDSSEEI